MLSFNATLPEKRKGRFVVVSNETNLKERNMAEQRKRIVTEDGDDLYNFSDRKWNRTGLPLVDKPKISPLELEKDAMGWPSALESGEQPEKNDPVDQNPRAY